MNRRLKTFQLFRAGGHTAGHTGTAAVTGMRPVTHWQGTRGVHMIICHTYVKLLGGQEGVGVIERRNAVTPRNVPAIATILHLRAIKKLEKILMGHGSCARMSCMHTPLNYRAIAVSGHNFSCGPNVPGNRLDRRVIVCDKQSVIHQLRMYEVSVTFKFSSFFFFCKAVKTAQAGVIQTITGNESLTLLHASKEPRTLGASS